MRVITFDIETQKEFAEVGGAHNRHLLGISVIGYHDSADDRYGVIREAGVLEFAKLLRTADLIVGFNVIHFDYPVLQPYLSLDTTKLPTLDLMADLERILGHRVSLDACAEATLGQKKSGEGLQAIQWYRQGRFDLLERYCLDDVRLTRQLYVYGRDHGEVSFVGKEGERRTVPVSWNGTTGERAQIRAVLERAHRDRHRVEITYVTVRQDGSTAERTTRAIDILAFRADAVDAYCHLRQDTRRFMVDRILDARVLDVVTNPGLAVGQHALL